MLNINAKSFVPPGAGSHFYPHDHKSGLYRYRVNLPTEKKIDTSDSGRYCSTVSSLLASKHLYGVRGCCDDGETRIFVNDAFSAIANVPVNVNEGKEFCGFFLSRSLLLHSADTNVINALNDATGFLIHLDVEDSFGSNVSNVLDMAWETLMSTVAADFRLTAFGYSGSLVGLNRTRTTGTYRHYFFVTCEPADMQLELFTAACFSGCQIPIARVVPVKCIVPFLCSSRVPLSLAVTVGDAARASFCCCSLVDYVYPLLYDPSDVSRTYESLSGLEDLMLTILVERSKWERTYILHVNIDVAKYSGGVGLPIGDVISRIGEICNDMAASVMCVSFSSAEEVPGGNELLAMNPNGPFYLDESWETILRSGMSLDTTNTTYHSVPTRIKKRISLENSGTVMQRALDILSENRQVFLKETLLTRTTFVEAAGHFAANVYHSRRRAVGTPVLLGTNASGEVFAVDVNSGSIFGLSCCFGGVVNPISLSLFKGTLCNSFRAYQNYRVIIDDVIIFQGNDMRRHPFAERWGVVESLCMDDENAWPHANPEHTVVLKALYVPFSLTENLMKMPPSDHASLGLLLVPTFQGSMAECNTYTWLPPESITAVFGVARVEEVPVGAEVKRVFLCVREGCEGRTMAPYEGEFADYHEAAHPSIALGCAVECILRRDNDGAHWWDVLRDFQLVDAQKVFTADEVDVLVHSPGISQKEMLWLLSAPTYQCARCHKVSDMGRRNLRHDAYWCRDCWRETGYGDCVYCGRTDTLGMLEWSSQLFYCENCWKRFQTPNVAAEVGYLIPPPPDATFTRQVTARCISIIIDLLHSKHPTNDVLELCCGGSVMRKWMRNKTMRYVGIDLKPRIVDTMVQMITSPESDMPENGRYDVTCADVFADDFWTHTVPKIHPRQFHVITCFAGLHYAFDTEERARHFIGSVANALVPWGTFVCSVVDASVLYEKGVEYSNSVFKVTWTEDALPRIGHSFSLETERKSSTKMNVVPIDFVVAVASEYDLHIIPKACQTFREIIEKDPNWTRSFSPEEKEYLCALRMIAFRKEGREQLPIAA